MKKKLIIILSVVLSLSMALTACAPAAKAADTASDTSGTAAAEEVQTSNSEAMQVELYDFDGNKVDIFADGKPVYVKTWASWCSYCLAGLGELDTLFTEDHDYKVVTVVAPGGNYGEMSEEDFKEWMAGLTEYPHVEVLFDRGGKFMDELGVRGFPSSYFFSINGELEGTHIGHMRNEEIDAAMAPLQ